MTTGTFAISMPAVVPATTGTELRVARREGDGGDLRLVAHLGEEEPTPMGSRRAHGSPWQRRCRARSATVGESARRGLGKGAASCRHFREGDETGRGEEGFH